jgi:hypothetical protein
MQEQRGGWLAGGGVPLGTGFKPALLYVPSRQQRHINQCCLYVGLQQQQIRHPAPSGGVHLSSLLRQGGTSEQAHINHLSHVQYQENWPDLDPGCVIRWTVRK